MSSSTAIEVINLSKKYQLGSIGHGSLHKDLQSWWAKVRKQADPNSKIVGTSVESGSDNPTQFLALNNISFKVKQGEIVGVIGRNGAGKSTLLKILSRITSPSEGEVRLRGRIVSLLEVGTGFHPELTGRENIFLNGAILGMSKKEISSKLKEIISFSELEKFIDTPVKRYSSGMTVRLAFAVAAHLESEILVVDEVLAVGDLNFRKKCLGKMKEISSGVGRTVLFVSHDMPSIQNICTSGILLDKGKIVYEGTALGTIKEYLHLNEAKNSSGQVWVAPDKVLPFSETVRIKSFSILENGQVTNGKLFNSKDYSISIQIDLIQSDPRLIFNVAFYSDNQELLFTTDLMDTGEHNFGDICPGTLELKVPIPKDLLSNGSYEIELLCAMHHTGWVLSPNNPSRIRFEFFKDKDLNPYANENRFGILAPILNWQINSRN
jgi:lipopolysaccharide transport system ATP-binding protein